MADSGRTPWQLTRLLMILCWLLWIVTFFITVTLFQAVLQIHVVSQVLQNVEKSFMWFSQDLVRATPLDVVDRGRLDEMLTRYYLEMRYSVIPDRVEMEHRWGENGIVAYLSSPAEYKNFKPNSSFFDKVDNMQPSVVDILKVDRKGTYFTVDFDVYTFDGSTNWRKEPRRVVVQYTYASGRKLLGRSISNPFGFIVTRVDESDRKSVTQ